MGHLPAITQEAEQKDPQLETSPCTETLSQTKSKGQTQWQLGLQVTATLT